MVQVARSKKPSQLLTLEFVMDSNIDDFTYEELFKTVTANKNTDKVIICVGHLKKLELRIDHAYHIELRMDAYHNEYETKRVKISYMDAIKNQYKMFLYKVALAPSTKKVEPKSGKNSPRRYKFELAHG